MNNQDKFKLVHQHLDLTETLDAWDRPKFAHSHIQATWLGWEACANDLAPDVQQLIDAAHHWKQRALAAEEARENTVFMRQLVDDDSRTGWTVVHPDFCCDLKRGADGKWAVSFVEVGSGQSVAHPPTIVALTDEQITKCIPLSNVGTPMVWLTKKDVVVAIKNAERMLVEMVK